MVEIVLGALVLYGGVVGAMFVFQRRIIYVPDRKAKTPDRSGLPEMAVVSYRIGDGLTLSGWYREPTVPDAPVLVYFQGNAGHIAERASKVRPFLDAGMGVLLAGYRGYGGNPGRPSEAGLYADGNAALNFVEARGVAPDRIVLYGESLGSGVAVKLASDRPVGAVVLEAPFTSAVDVGAAAYPWVPVRLAMRDRFDSVSRIGGVAAPVLVMHGERDRTTPVRLGRRLLAAAAEPKEGHFFPLAGHTDLHDHGAVAVVLDFLRTHGLTDATTNASNAHPPR
jgi:fermentation-respiration switch protein FrsA (DUF1100 family)